MTRFEPVERPVEVSGSGHVAIATSDAGRAVLFYWRVFGLQPIACPGDDGTPRVLMHGRGICLALCERRRVRIVPKRLLFQVHDVDEARARLWDLGVALADGCIEPHFDPERNCRSLHVRDPDGHSIELVEAPVAHAAPHGRREQAGVPPERLISLVGR
jgi:catechol 2,3-dioxygenase-like lactoylglutathione lyase family enzyme